ncbi:hypothetical protein D8B26_007534 [Coccidioides posadasii str. Silveira]|uniref:Uncharacterized protein n=1 Tax=Coccidioides posadasii (strain RMSCC 757 / Silveira) TaxID=443226 RepID=E9D275_COCPS|nr:hypothetical protein CPSG_03673 [Coccidioides posadasii str. Silveira]QVM12917.1 hypothetical protein D8B26_007534 [Coccidioides posadasii str. Silveira]
MSGIVDPATGEPLPADAIQRVLYVCHPVHVYAIPPLMSMKGYTAADWTTPDPRNDGKTKEIFTARLRILETAIPVPASPLIRSGRPATSAEEPQEKVKTDILLEDVSTGDLFAAAPYTDAGVVEHVIDSSRFFALRVVGEGRKAMLGIGFEDRSEAFDFGVSLQEARKVLGFKPVDGDKNVESQKGPMLSHAAVGRRPGVAPPRGRVCMSPGIRQQPPKPQTSPRPVDAKPKDYSLKPGQTITIDMGDRQRPERPFASSRLSDTPTQEDRKAPFPIPPPPPPPAAGAASSGNGLDQSLFFIPPPPAARDSRTDRRRRPLSTLEPTTQVTEQKHSPSGFDDDEDFGEFQ